MQGSDEDLITEDNVGDGTVDVGGDNDLITIDVVEGDTDYVGGDIKDCVIANTEVTNIYGDSWLHSSEAATTPLYEGSPTTVLHALVKHFHWFTDHPGISKEALSAVLATEYSLLPPGNSLPSSYDAALRAINPYLVQPVIFDVCENDCIIFRREHAHLTECPKCFAPRYISEQSHISRRHFTYLPLKPRLTRFFGTANLAGVLQSHATTNLSHSGAIFDIHQSEAWREAYSGSGIFKGDPQGVSLALCTDGVNPFAHNRVTYSMWPVMLTLLNLPRNLRNRFASILLVGIIPANGTKEPQNLNPYLDVLVDELL